MVYYYNGNATQTKNVFFYQHTIFTVVTKDPDDVTAWISEITTENINGGRGRLVIGLDTEWRPNSGPGVENPVAIVQLCVGNRCLIFQIIHAPYIPQSLIDLLNNRNHTLTGAGIQTDVDKLERHYGLGRAGYGFGMLKLGANVVDVEEMAAQMYGLDRNGLGLKTLARMFLGKEPEKPKSVARSNWDIDWLSPPQIDYATIDAFLSSEIGRVLLR